ncbi:MAG: hypothetical protein AB1730_15280 [Myxococcota bacterium]
MMLTRTIGPNTVRVEVLERQRAQAEALLDKLAELDARGPRLQDGTTIDFGWSRLTLVDVDGILDVEEPEFRGDPFESRMPGAFETIGVAQDQVDVLRRVGVEGVDARFDSAVIVRRGCLSAPRIYLKRDEPEGRSSGWYIGDVAHPEVEKEDLEVITVADVFKQRSEAMRVLALPPGYMAVLDGSVIEAVVDPEGKVVARDF